MNKKYFQPLSAISLAFGTLEGASPLQNAPRTVWDCRGACGGCVAPEASTGVKN